MKSQKKLAEVAFQLRMSKLNEGTSLPHLNWLHWRFPGDIVNKYFSKSFFLTILISSLTIKTSCFLWIFWWKKPFFSCAYIFYPSSSWKDSRRNERILSFEFIRFVRPSVQYFSIGSVLLLLLFFNIDFSEKGETL